jgi:hypothetical protein
MKIARLLSLALAALFLPLLAHAATATINWSAPTTASDGTSLTGAQAITSYQVWVSTATIPANTAMPPTATITGTATTTTQSITANPGATIYARVKACNSAGCSDFSVEATKVLPVTTPNPPTNVTITLVIGP